MKKFAMFIVALAAFASCATLKDGEYTYQIVTTQDVYGRWFDSTFVKPAPRPSLLAVENIIRPMREEGKLILIDAGNMGGNGNAAFYYEKVAKESILPKIIDYLGYDALLPKASLIVRDGIRFAVAPYDEALAFAKKNKADVVIAEIDGKRYDKENPDVTGIDILVAHNDGRSYARMDGNTLVIDSGRSARKVGTSTITIKVEGKKVVDKTVEGQLENVKVEIDEKTREKFADAYAQVSRFSRSVIGKLEIDLDVDEAFKGQSDYINFYQTLALSYPNVDVAFSSFLALGGKIEKGEIIFNDIASTLYPFENKITILSLSGEEIRSFLEASYDLQLQYENGKPSPANFEFGAGINYTVDVNKPLGERVNISSFADGRPFELDQRYNVAMSSYRAVGAGGLLESVGLKSAEAIKSRILEEGPTYRELLYDYIKKDPYITRERISAPSYVGRWEYIR
ncbi:MAG: 5'-nucleotidase C-terminal domain-containing protein [Bacteroidales bacterium]|nr:5'-nucleotidase C-terminal domain-containing protein [Bacteroidales bacterium]